jgi:hypothetical protein
MKNHTSKYIRYIVHGNHLALFAGKDSNICAQQGVFAMTIGYAFEISRDNFLRRGGASGKSANTAYFCT